MNLDVHRAVFGESGRRHALRATSLPTDASGALESLAALTDRPSADPPPGAKPALYLSGFPFREWYVLTRTFPDVEASRGGMVRSFCLLTPLVRIRGVSDLTILLSLLPHVSATPAEWASWETPTALEVNVPEEAVPPAYTQKLVPERLGFAARLLDGPHPAVWVGPQADFEFSCATLWASLPASLRPLLRFGHSNAPTDLPGETPHFVSSPNLAGPRWADRVVQPLGVGRASKAALLLVGHPDAEPLVLFLAGLPELTDISRLKRAAACLELLEAFDGGAVATALPAARLLKELAPHPDQQARRKAELLDALVRQLADGEPQTAGRFANFAVEAFVGAEQRLKHALADWSRRWLLTNDDRMAGLIGRAFGPDALGWWAEGILVTLRNFTAQLEPAIRVNLWSWWQQDPRLVARFVGWLPADADQKMYLSAPSTLNRAVAQAVVDCLPEAMVQLQAVGWAVLLPPADAILRCTSPAPQQQLAMEALRNRWGDEAFLEAALKAGVEAGLAEAGRALVQTPSLLARLDAGDAGWRRVWVEAVASGAPPLDFVPDPAAAVAATVNAALAGNDVPPELFVALSRTPHASLLDHPRRSAAWATLPEASRSGFLTATARALLERWREGAQAEPEVQLAQAVLDPRLLVAALQLRSSGRASILLNYIRLLTRRGAPEATFIAVIEALRDYGVSLPGEQVVEFAAFIRQHHQQSVAEAALNAYEAKRSPTLYLLAEHTLAVLPTLRKLRAVLSLRRPYAVNDFYAALAQALARLFPHGPHRNGVWEDAGGDPSDLEASGSGYELWRSALRLVRRGQVPLQRLLEVVRYRYPDDPELQELDRLSSWL